MTRLIWRAGLIVVGVLMLTAFAVAQQDDGDDDPCERRFGMQARACLDLPYGEDEQQALDLYLPLESDSTFNTLVVMIHGDGFSGGSKNSDVMEDYAEFFAQHGYAAASLDYRLQPDHAFPAQLSDAYCALGWLFDDANAEMYGYRPRQVFVMGQSTGGLLASLIGTNNDPTTHLADCEYPLPEENPVDGVISFFAPSDISETGFEARADLVPSLLDLSDPELQGYSPLYLVDSDDVPFLLVHGDDDEVVPISESQRFDDALTEAGIPGDFLVVEGADHDIDDWSRGDYFQALSEVLMFIEEFGEGTGIPL